MKRYFAYITPFFICGQLLASEAPQDPTPVENFHANVQLEAQNWATEVAQLDLEEQKKLANLIHWSGQVAHAGQLFRKFRACFIGMTHTLCQNGSQLKKQPYTQLQVAQQAMAFVKFSETYRTIFGEWKTAADLFGQEESNLSEECIQLYAELKKQTQQHIYDYLELHGIVTDMLVSKNKESLFLVPKRIDVELKNHYDQVEHIVETVQEDQRKLFQINMTSVAADILWHHVFASVQAALRASKPKEILENVSQTIFKIYFEQLCNNCEYDFGSFLNNNQLIPDNQSAKKAE